MSASDIVVGLDDTTSGRAALRWAAELAVASGTRLRVVRAWAVPPPVEGSFGSGLRHAAAEDARARSTQTVLQVLDGLPRQPVWRLELAEGSPGPVLSKAAGGARLVVVGTTPNGLRRTSHRTVAGFCINRATCPVVAVPAPVADERSSDVDVVDDRAMAGAAATATS
jgi:nucleotide-binding universal stress UspA family protein